MRGGKLASLLRRLLTLCANGDVPHLIGHHSLIIQHQCLCYLYPPTTPLLFNLLTLWAFHSTWSRVVSRWRDIGCSVCITPVIPFHNGVSARDWLGICVPFLQRVTGAGTVLATMGSAIPDEHEASERSHTHCVQARPTRKYMVMGEFKFS